MRYVLLILLLFASAWGYGQKKHCSFALDSIIVPDSLYSCQLLDTIRRISFIQYYRKSKIPRFIKKALNCWADGFDIANPGRPANLGCSRDLFSIFRPDRELLYLGLYKNYMLMSYKRGTRGINSPIVLFRYENKKIISVWYWQWFANNIKSKEELLLSLKFYSRLRGSDPYF